jgi:hypothetical protein
LSDQIGPKPRVWDDPENGVRIAEFCRKFTDKMRAFDFSKHETLDLLKIILKD